MFFKSPTMVMEMPLAHPELQALAKDLDAQSLRWDLGEVVITDIFRDPKFYADKRWSWHFCGCAMDIRTRNLTDLDRARFVAWLQGRCFNSKLKIDIVSEPNAAKGPHIHIEIEDWDRRRKWEQRTGKNSGAT